MVVSEIWRQGGMEQNISLCIIVMSLRLFLHGQFIKLCKMLCKRSFKSPFIRTIIIASLNVHACSILTGDFPGGSVVKNPPAVQEMQIQTLG